MATFGPGSSGPSDPILELSVGFRAKEGARRVVSELEGAQEDARKRGDRKEQESQKDLFERRSKLFRASVNDEVKRRKQAIDAEFQSERRRIRGLLKERLASNEITASDYRQKMARAEAALRQQRDRALAASGPQAVFGSARRIFGDVAVGNLIADAAQATVRELREAIGAAYELGTAVEETGSKFNTTFGDAAADVDAFLDTFANVAGLTKTEGREITATLASIAQGFGLSKAESAAFSAEAVKLAGDLASFNNVGIEEAVASIQSGLVGEIEPLRKFGINLSAAEVEARALADTGKDTADSLTDQDKILARLALAYQKAGVQVGDLERTQDSTANTARRLSAQFREQREDLAASLIPAYALALEAIEAFTGGVDGGSDALISFVSNGVFDAVAGLAQVGAELATTADLFLSLASASLDTGEGLLGFSSITSQLAAEVQRINSFIANAIILVNEFIAAVEDAGAVGNRFFGDDEAADDNRKDAARARARAQSARDALERGEERRDDVSESIDRLRERLAEAISGATQSAVISRAATRVATGTERRPPASDRAATPGRGERKEASDRDRENEVALAAAERLNDELETLTAERIESEEARALASIKLRFDREREELRALAAEALKADGLTAKARAEIKDDLKESLSALGDLERREIEAVKARRLEAESEVLDRRRSAEAEVEAARLDAAEAAEAREIERIEDRGERERAQIEAAYRLRVARLRQTAEAEIARIEATETDEETAALQIQAVRIALNTDLEAAEADRIKKVQDLQTKALKEMADEIKPYVDVVTDELFASARGALFGGEDRELSRRRASLRKQEFQDEENDLLASLRNREISYAEYSREVERLSIERAEYEREQQEENAGFFVRSYRGLRDVAIAALQDYVAEFLVTKAAELAGHVFTEEGKTLATIGAAAKRGIALAAEAGQALFNAAASVVSAIATQIKQIVSVIPFPFNLAAIPVGVAAVTGAYLGAKKLFFAGGGYVGEEGERGRDEVQITVGRGEAILNHHQQNIVEDALQRTGRRGGLRQLFREERRPHYAYATGGFADFAPLLATPSTAPRTGSEGAPGVDLSPLLDELRVTRAQLDRRDQEIAQLKAAPAEVYISDAEARLVRDAAASGDAARRSSVPRRVFIERS